MEDEHDRASRVLSGEAVERRLREPSHLSFFFFKGSGDPRDLPSSPPRRSPDLAGSAAAGGGAAAAAAAAAAAQGPVGARCGLRPSLVGTPGPSRVTARDRARASCADTAPTAARDRKSTRLNSSHSQISYAVFCL